jgi:hypothetical protein
VDIKQNYQTPWSNSGDLHWDKGNNRADLFIVLSFYAVCAQTAHQLGSINEQSETIYK